MCVKSECSIAQMNVNHGIAHPARYWLVCAYSRSRAKTSRADGRGSAELRDFAYQSGLAPGFCEKNFSDDDFPARERCPNFSWWIAARPTPSAARLLRKARSGSVGPRSTGSEAGGAER